MFDAVLDLIFVLVLVQKSFLKLDLKLFLGLNIDKARSKLSDPLSRILKLAFFVKAWERSF